ncbi:hypothetical protein BKA65DRAFT_290646 [Rhexocercosporidium sp. MPI-PUGE-AT-0058]|nr:hypothetical protein BKA65DRAFT_290646 [Rhexocercosporidium sp. MPI-PUGE-AT-0058]
MSTSQLDTKDCKVEVRKYVLVSQPSRWHQKGQRVVVQSPMLNIPKDVSFVPVKRFNGEEQNLVCFLPRTDIERDSNDAYQRLHVSRTPSSIEAHGTAICDGDPSDDFLYIQNDRFWIHVNSSTDGYNDKVPVINLRTYQSGAIPVDHVCWFPKIHSTSWCSETHSRREQLWTTGGPTRKLKLSGSKNYALWSFVVCQFTDGTNPVAKSVKIPTKDTQSSEARYLSLSESSLLFDARRRRMVEKLHGNCPPHPPAFLPPTPPASPELDMSRKVGKGKDIRPKTVASVPVDEVISIWARIGDMVTRRAFQSNHYVLRTSLVHPRRCQSAEGSMERGRSASIALPTDKHDNDSGCSFNSTTSGSRDVSPDSQADAEYLRKVTEGRRVHYGILLKEFKEQPRMFRTYANLGGRPAGLPFSAADPLIASDPTRIRADWEAKRQGHNPNPDNLCQNNDLHCSYTTKYTCKHYHPDPAKCYLGKQPLLELYNYSAANRRGWMAWTEGNRAATQYRHVEHEHCITRLYPYPAGAGDCMLAGIPPRNHVCCLWAPVDLDGLAQNFIRAYNKLKDANAQRHRVTIFDQSNLVRTETRIVDIGIADDQLGLGSIEDTFGKELNHLQMENRILDNSKDALSVERFLKDLVSVLIREDDIKT